MRGVGGYNGWRWIFILVCFLSDITLVPRAGTDSSVVYQEGLLTVVVAIGAYFFVYNYPATAEFLTEEEREYIHLRLKCDSDATRDESFTWGNVSAAFKDPKVWLYGLGFHTMSLPLYTYSLFLVRLLNS